jgi:hypothetical protein
MRDMGAPSKHSKEEKLTLPLNRDAFTRRESASEEMWIRDEEKAKLKLLKEKLTKQKEHIDKLTKDM